MQSDALGELLVYGLHHVKAAVLLKGLGEDLPEQLLLAPGGERDLRTEDRVDKVPVDLRGVL